MRWSQGEAVVERLVAEGRLERVTGARADGTGWLERAGRTLRTAAHINTDDPDSAYVFAYDAARQACVGILAHQGLRPTTAGGHYAVEEAVRAQFGDVFRRLGMLRRRRNELEYPAFPDEHADPEEIHIAIAAAERIVDAARWLLPNLGVF
jgi:HEPN domain